MFRFQLHFLFERIGVCVQKYSPFWFFWRDGVDKVCGSTQCHIQSHEGRDLKYNHSPADNNMTVYRRMESLIAV